MSERGGLERSEVLTYRAADCPFVEGEGSRPARQYAAGPVARTPTLSRSRPDAQAARRTRGTGTTSGVRPADAAGLPGRTTWAATPD
jgi:hypothetical protein